jgi:hypothetical protein
MNNEKLLANFVNEDGFELNTYITYLFEQVDGPPEQHEDIMFINN